jgi:hypothetical protein
MLNYPVITRNECKTPSLSLKSLEQASSNVSGPAEKLRKSKSNITITVFTAAVPAI